VRGGWGGVRPRTCSDCTGCLLCRAAAPYPWIVRSPSPPLPRPLPRRAALELEQAGLEELAQQQLQQQQQQQAHAALRGARKEAERWVARLFEAGLDAYGAEDSDLWLALAKYEGGRGKGGGHVYWRATRALVDPDPFVLRFRALQQGG